MTARISWNQRNTRGHRPRLQMLSSKETTGGPEWRPRGDEGTSCRDAQLRPVGKKGGYAAVAELCCLDGKPTAASQTNCHEAIFPVSFFFFPCPKRQLNDKLPLVPEVYDGYVP